MKKGDKMYLISNGYVSMAFVDEVGFGFGNGFSVIRADGSKTEDGMLAQDVYKHYGFAFGWVYKDGKRVDVFCVKKMWHYPLCKIAKWVYNVRLRMDIWILAHKKI